MNMDMVCHGQSFTIIQKQTKLKSTELSCCSLHEREYEYFRHNPILTIFRKKNNPRGNFSAIILKVKSFIYSSAISGTSVLCLISEGFWIY